MTPGRYASESLIDTFFNVIPTSCQKWFSTKTIPSGINLKTFIVVWHPKGPNQTLRIRILDRYGFQCYPDILPKRFSTKAIPSGMNFKVFLVLWCPKGPSQTLRIRIFDRYVFSAISTSGSHLDYIWKSYRPQRSLWSPCPMILMTSWSTVWPARRRRRRESSCYTLE